MELGQDITNKNWIPFLTIYEIFKPNIADALQGLEIILNRDDYIW